MVKSKRNLLLIILSVVFAFTLISFVSAKPVSADAVPVITMKESASVRFDPDRSGLRFTAYVAESVELDEDTYAGIIVARGDVENLEYSEEADIMNIKAVKYDPNNNDPELGRAFNAVIYDIDAAGATAQVLTARAYVCDNGAYTYSTNDYTCSLAEVASKLLEEMAEPTPNEEALLKHYIDEAAAVVSVDGEAFDESKVMNVEIMTGETVAITVNPSNIKASVLTANSEISIANGVITAKSPVENAEVEITLGSAKYTLNVKVNPFVDNNIEDLVLADFDEAGYVDLATIASGDGGGYRYFLTGENAANEIISDINVGAGVNGGMLKFTSQSYDSVKVMFNKTITLDKVVALNIRYWGSLAATKGNSQFRITLVHSDGTFSTAGADLFALEAPAKTWTTIRIPVSTFTSRFASDAEIAGILLYWIGGFNYVDEISYEPTFWENKNAEDNEVASFDDAKYIYNVKSVNTSGAPGTPSILLGEDATAVGADSGIVKVTLNNYNALDVYPQNKFMLSEVDYIVFKVRYTNFAGFRFAFHDENGKDIRYWDGANAVKSFSEGGGQPKFSTALAGTSFASSYNAFVEDTWNTIILPASALTSVYNDSVVVDRIRLYNNIGSAQTLYVDEIYTVVGEIEENVTINGVKLTKDAVNNIEVVAGQSLTVEGDVINPTIATTSKVLSKSGNVVTATNWLVPAQTMTVTAGNTYTVNVTIKPWVDTNKDANVLLDFDEAEYAYAATWSSKDGCIDVVASEIADGAINVTTDPRSGKNYNYLCFGLGEELDTTKIASITIRIKTTLKDTDYRIRFKNSAGEGTGAYCSNLANITYRNATKDADGWATITLSASALGVDGNVAYSDFADYIVISTANVGANYAANDTEHKADTISIDYISVTLK